MVELKNDQLVFSYPKVHRKAKLTISLHRTLRIPDDDKTYYLPPGLGNFPLRHIDDHRESMTMSRLKYGGVIMPMYQAEALWIGFECEYLSGHYTEYPFAVKIATGKINAVSGKAWDKSLKGRPQNYVVVPEQPWLDGYNVGKGTIRQFVAMPLGKGYTAEEQLNGKAEFGGLQIQAFPMKRKVFLKRFPLRKRDHDDGMVKYMHKCNYLVQSNEMGLAPGGKMKQEIYDDPYSIDDWDIDNTSRCFIHIFNSEDWIKVTGDYPPIKPPTAKDYSTAGLPWFDYYNDNPDIKVLKGAKKLKDLKTVSTMGEIKGEKPMPENESFDDVNPVKLKKKKGNVVREGDF